MISAGGCIFLALMLLCVPLKWIAAAVLAAFIHECFHYLAIKLCAGSVDGIRMGAEGMRMHIAPMSEGKELICALAGPAGGFLLLFVSKWFPRTALCGVIHSFYNLLPLYPLDGGRALRCGARLLFKTSTVDKICMWIEAACLWGSLLVSLYAVIRFQVGIVPLLLVMLLWWKTKNTIR